MRATVVATALILLLPAVVGAQQLPSVVQRAISENDSVCGTNAKHLGGFITKRDITGTGKPGYIIDYGSFECDGSRSFFCGTAGCLLQIFAPDDAGGYQKVIDDNIQAYRLGRQGGRATITLNVHGSACGRSGASLCKMTLFWNGTKFSPAN